MSSLGPVVNILAIFSNAKLLKYKRIKIYHIKGIGCPLLISILSFLTKERKNKKEEKMIRLEPRLLMRVFVKNFGKFQQNDVDLVSSRPGRGLMLWLFVGPTGVYLLDFFCSGIQFYLLLSPYLCFVSFLYLDLYF